MFDADYINKLKERGKTSHVYKQFQDIGLQIAEILHDAKHKALYIKLAKQHDESILLSIAKDVADRKGIANRGAYFMKVLHERYPLPKKEPLKKEPKKKAIKKTVKNDTVKRAKDLVDHEQGGGKIPA
jgi:hypothetical protein